MIASCSFLFLAGGIFFVKPNGQRSNLVQLIHWGRMTHICVSSQSPSRRQAIIETNAGILIWPLGTSFSEILIEILTFPFKKMRLKVSAKQRTFCLGLYVSMGSVAALHLGVVWFLNINVCSPKCMLNWVVKDCSKFGTISSEVGVLLMTSQCDPRRKHFRLIYLLLKIVYCVLFQLGLENA